MKVIIATYRQMVAEFLLFLKENNALRGYQRAVRRQKLSCFQTIGDKINIFSIKPLSILFTSGRYSELINLAFKWNGTKEGHEYWSKLDLKWRRIISDIEFQIVNEKIYRQ